MSDPVTPSPSWFSRWFGGAPTAAPALPALEMRADVEAPTLVGGSVKVGTSASIANLVTGAGTTKDSTTYSRPNTARAYLQREELFTMMRGGLYRRLCAIRPAWATRAGWTFGGDNAKELDAMGEALGLSHAFRYADTWGRGTGEFRLWLVTNEADTSKPLRPSEEIKRLQRLDRREFRAIEWNDNAIEGEIGAPTVYQVQPSRAGGIHRQLNIHASRLLDFWGHDLAPSDRGVEGWGDRDAVGQVIWDAINALDTTSMSGARIASELMVAVYGVGDLPELAAGDDAAGLFSRLRGINLMKSMANAILLGQGETFERQTANVSGYRDLSDQARLMLSAVEGTPQTLLFGMPPAGFNTDGESWQEMWFADVAQHQEDRYRRHLEYIGQHFNGGKPVDLEFRPLGELDAIERANLREIVTRTDLMAIDGGILTSEEARTRYVTAGQFQAELEEAIEALPEVEEASMSTVDPEALASAQAMVEAIAAREAAGAVGVPPAVPSAPSAPPVADGREDALPGTAWIGLVVDPSALPDLPPDAHLTLLYLGEVGSEALAEIVEVAKEVAERDPLEVFWLTRATFRAAPGQPVPEVYLVDVDSGFSVMNTDLLRALAHLVSARQHEAYRPHVTIGYLPFDAPLPAATSIRPAVPVVLSTLRVMYDGRTVFEVALGR